MNKTLLLKLCTAAFMIVGCSQQSPVLLPTQSSPTIQFTPTSSVVTVTNIPPTATLEPTQIPDLTRLSSECIEISNAIPPDIHLKGSLVLDNPKGVSTILNLETGKQIPIGTTVADVSVSPDRQKFAYLDFEREMVLVSDVNGQIQKSFKGFGDQFSLIEWVDNTNLAFNQAQEEKPPFYNFWLIVLNSETSEKRKFDIADYPKGNKYYKVFWNYYSELIPNPGITKIIYSTDEGGMPIYLWDLNSNSEIKKIYLMDTTTSPRWSSDGRRFITSIRPKHKSYSNVDDNLPFAGGEDLFLISDTGELKRLTFLSTQYRQNSIIEYTWSKTENKIAFWLGIDENSGLSLAILDVVTGEITTYCVGPDETNPQNDKTWSKLIWSPDENHLAFTRTVEPFNSSVFILDLENKIVFKIKNDAIVMGWMVSK